ncbi:MAG: hypothetical protein SWQ30_22855 [Thermodesulfobacteriota bacterium]|nr:hypothetical protein [Thermodesulfobacteriota bacterium]
MKPFTRGNLQELMHECNGPCISIFMPTHRGAAETLQDQIRFKNLLREAEENLAKRGLHFPEAGQFLESAQALQKDSLFWRHQMDGLAVFLSPEMSRFYRLPMGFKELVVVTNRFHIKPLFPLLSGDGRFYVLALSQKEVRLLQGSRHSLTEVDLKGMTSGLPEAFTRNDIERQVQLHTGTPQGATKRAAIFHGHGSGATDNKDKILQCFRQVDRSLHEVLREEQAPLVLAGVDFLFPIYGQANTYQYLVDEGISGNPEGVSADELHDEAWKIVQPYFQTARDEAMALYRQMTAMDRSSCDIKTIVRSAYYGRVEILFAAVGLQSWGMFDLATDKVCLRDQAGPGDEDLLDFAAIHTLFNGGTVYAVEPDEVPGDTPLAAVFRY